jgi:hypothetical protein
LLKLGPVSNSASKIVAVDAKSNPLQLWLWEYTDDQGKRRVTRYRLTEKHALERYGETVSRVEGSLEERTPLGHTSDWLRHS